MKKQRNLDIRKRKIANINIVNHIKGGNGEDVDETETRTTISLLETVFCSFINTI